MSQDYVLPASAGIGHVHLKVSDLEVAIGFYRDVLGFQQTARFGDEAAFLSAGGYHHHIALNTWESRGGRPAPRTAPGLYHLAIRLPDRRALAVALRRVLDAGVRLHGAADHGVSESIYLADPDGNGIELTVDRPRDAWRHEADGSIVMTTGAFDLRALLEEAALPAADAPERH